MSLKKKKTSQLAVPFLCVPLFTPHLHLHHQLVFMPDTAEGRSCFKSRVSSFAKSLSLFISLHISLSSVGRKTSEHYMGERERGDRQGDVGQGRRVRGWIYYSFLSYGSEVSGGGVAGGVFPHWPLGVRSPMFFTRRWLKSASSPSPRGPCTSGRMRPWRCRW